VLFNSVSGVFDDLLDVGGNVLNFSVVHENEKRILGHEVLARGAVPGLGGDVLRTVSPDGTLMESS
jgi:hypothetical protein